MMKKISLLYDSEISFVRYSSIDIDERFEIEMEMDNLNIWENVSQM